MDELKNDSAEESTIEELKEVASPNEAELTEEKKEDAEELD